ncbi:MAG: 3-dehydroquinate synthase [Rickettsiales bacterium]|nr:3-dehydroquinate synthase [Rickettsiales bacterium]
MKIALPDGRSYPIHIGQGLLAKAGELIDAPRTIIITDENVAPHWLDRLTENLNIGFDVIVLPAGEATKSFNLLEQLLNELLGLKPDRKTLLIALGGGVVGDITGFAASILLRGVPFVQIPTTLLSQVDSSVGGKTGINSEYGKNLIGSFYQPQAVIIDPDTLSTLPDRELRAGFGEVIKAACIHSETFFAWLEKNHLAILNRDTAALTHTITQSVQIKATIVEQDEREAGVRALLNLGHTFGHALEVELAYDGTLVHGEAVAIGMAMAFTYCANQGICSEVDAKRVIALIESSDLPVTAHDWPTAETLLAHMQQDKKAENGELTLVLARTIGDCFIEKQVDCASMVDFLRKYGQN